MRPSLVLLLFLCCFLWIGGSLALIQREIRIPLYQRQYVQVKVGHPGRPLTLRLRWDLNVNYLYDSPYTYSNTFSSTGGGSDVFYLSPSILPLRLPVIYDREPSQLQSSLLPHYNGMRQDTSGGVSYNGILAMGPTSAIWQYWSSFTISKYTLVLGGAFDPVDSLGIDAIQLKSKIGFLTLIDALGSENGTLPIDFDLAEEFTFVPLRIYPSIYDLVFKKNDHRISNLISPNNSTSSRSSLLFWMSSSSSVITTSYGGPERTLQISERAGKNASQITLGRIHLLEDFVYHQNKATGMEVVQEVYDTFPSAEDEHAPDAFLALLSLILWAVWTLETSPMLYQWNAFGIFPRVRQICNELINTNLMNLLITTSSTPTTKPTAKPIGDSIFRSPSSLPSPSQPYPTLGIGPVDWTIVTCMLTLTRILSLWTFYISIWGYRSSRFAEHLARFAYLDPWVGKAQFYAILCFVLVIPFVVNTYFIRRYTHAGTSLIQCALLLCVWIHRLPDTSSLLFSVFINLLLSSLVLLRVCEWLSWASFRGSDSAISIIVAKVKEYPSEQALSKSEVSSIGRLQQTSKEVQGMIQDTIHRLKHPGTHQQRLPTYRPSSTPSGLPSPPEVPDQELLERSLAGRYSTGEVILLVLWILVLLPSATTWVLTLNVIPVVEILFPTHPARIWMAAFYLAAFLAYFAWATVCRTFLQILQQGVVDIREAMIVFANNLKSFRSSMK